MVYNLVQERIPELSITEQVCYNRGIDPSDVEGFLNTVDEDVHSPFDLMNMKEAIALLIGTINKNGKTLVIVDSDADGFTSSAILINYLYRVFPSYVDQYLDVHFHQGKEHGIVLSEHGDELFDYNLVIIPDAGSDQGEEHSLLKSKGIDVLVLDHHEIEGELSTDAVIVNNVLTEGYTNKALSGAGVTYQFCLAIDKLSGRNEAPSLIDLVSVGLIADMMSMLSLETKHLIIKGLDNISNPLIQGLVEKQEYSLGGKPNPIGISFYIAPMINATIRVGTQEEKQIMFYAMLEKFAYNKVPSTKRGEKGKEEYILVQAIRNCTNIRNRQIKIRDKGTEYIEDLIEKENLNDRKALIILMPKDNDVDKRVTGLIANQLLAKYKKSIILAREGVDEETGVKYYSGSARGLQVDSESNFKEFLANSGLFEYTSGHPNAFGCCIAETNLDAFYDYIDKNIEEVDSEYTTGSYTVDFVFDTQLNPFKENDILSSLREIIELKKFWGRDFEEPLVAIKGIEFDSSNRSIQLLSADKNPTIKISCNNSGLDLLKFKSSQEEFEELTSHLRQHPNGSVLIDVIGKPSLNCFRGEESVQLFISEYKVSNNKNHVF